MTFRGNVLVLLFLSLAIGIGPAPAAAGDLVPEYPRVQLQNGLTLLLLEHHALPLVSFEMMMRAGSIVDPDGREGLADITMELLRKGTKRHNAEQLAEELDFLGATLSLSAGLEGSRIGAQFLAKDIDAGLALLTDVVLRPTFPEDELRKLIDLRVNAIKEAKDNPRQVIPSYYESFLFQGHVFARATGGTETSVPAITRSDVVGFHGTHVRPNNVILAVAGDFKHADMQRKIEKAFGSWEKGSGVRPAPTAPAAVSGRRVLLVDKPDATQTYFRFGNVGVAKGNADTDALDLVNTVFGGRFTSWLMNEMRTKSGLTYNAHANFVQRTVPGPFYVSSFTKTADTEKAIDMALAILERLHAEGPTAEELDSARNYIRGQYPPDYESAADLAGAMVELEFYGLGRDYINGHTARVDAVTPDDVRRVIGAHYPRADLSLVMIGPAEQVASVAKKYGTVQQRKISDAGF